MIDLHTHSTASDGSLSPTQLVAQAEAAGITYLALTDHNTASGLPEFLRAAADRPIRPIAGVEITCQLDDQELHMLALDLPEAAFSPMETFLADARRRGEESRRALVDSLNTAGFALSYEAIQSAHPDSVTNRAHIAEALLSAGYVRSVREAFDTLLSEEAGYYHPAPRLEAAEVVAMIRWLGGLPVWAHPFLRLDEKRVECFLPQLVPAGLAGMEVYYSTYTPAQTQAAIALAHKFSLRPSGGSDFHGSAKPDIALGVGKGDLRIPESVAEALLRR